MWYAITKNQLLTAFKQDSHVIRLASTIILLPTNGNLYIFFKNISFKFSSPTGLFPCFIFQNDSLYPKSYSSPWLIFITASFCLHTQDSFRKDALCYAASLELVVENFFVIWRMCSRYCDRFAGILPVQCPRCDIYQNSLHILGILSSLVLEISFALEGILNLKALVREVTLSELWIL